MLDPNSAYWVILVITLTINPVWVPGVAATTAYGIHVALQIVPAAQRVPSYRLRTGTTVMDIYREVTPQVAPGTSIDIPIHLMTFGGS